MAKKKAKKQSSSMIRYDTKNIFFSIIFIVFGVISIFGEGSMIGNFVNDFLLYLFGEYYKIIFSPIVIILGIFLFAKESFSFSSSRFFGLILYFISLTTLFGFFGLNYFSFLNFNNSFKNLFGYIPSMIFVFLILLFSLFLMFRISYKKIIKKMISISPDFATIKDTISLPGQKDEKILSEKSQSKINKELEEIDKMKKTLEEEILKAKKSKKEPEQLSLEEVPRKILVEKVKEKTSIFSKIKENLSNDNNDNSDNIQENVKKEEINIKIEDKNLNKKIEKKVFNENKYEKWVLPNFDLLSNIGGDIQINENDIFNKQQEIIDKLKQFKIDINMTGYRVGPTVIQFRLQPEEGVKLNKIENLKKDLTLALKAKSIRIQAPIPGEGVVGIEVPNENRQVVGLKELITSKEFKNPKFEIPIAIGKDVSGEFIVGDLTRMPHLLVAGQTASGKSVGMNGFIISMLYKFSPSDLKIIMVDPKRVELSIYNGIPHLLTPVITNPEKALNALKWAIAEMLRRYDLATEVNARNFKEYNAKVEDDKKLPYIVIVVDELADLMMSGNKKEVETSIARIAQMARAVGMHLIIATQRPSVDVITGLIKANVPSRIAFTVASQIDSRTVLDKCGAEDLLGRGDMLYSPTGILEPLRVQGVLVETHEVEEVVNYIKLNIDPDMLDNLYNDDIVNGRSNATGSILENYSGDQDEEPEIIEKAIAIVKESKKGSTSLIQRKLGLGYARAAKVLDILEELGVVGPANGSKPREVYE